jgi:hypothetical protein
LFSLGFELDERLDERLRESAEVMPRVAAALSEAVDSLGDVADALNEATRASTAAWIKFFALGAHGLLVAAVCFRATPRRWIVGAAMVLPLLGVIAAATDPDTRAGLMTLGMTLGWLTLMAFAAKEAIWPVRPRRPRGRLNLSPIPSRTPAGSSPSAGPRPLAPGRR